MMRWMVSALCAVITVLVMLPAQAEDVQASVYDFYPMGDADRLDGRFLGMFYEMTQAILEASGLDYEINVEPIARTFARIKQGGTDLMIGLPTPNAELSVPIHCNHVVVVSNTNKLQTIADLKGARIGFVAGGLFERLYGNKFGTENEVSSSDYGLINMLMLKRIDGFMITENVINAYRVAPQADADLPPGWDEGLHTAVTIKVNQVYLQFPPGTTLTDVQKSRIVSSAYDLNEKGRFATIMAKYGTEQIRTCPGMS